MGYINGLHYIERGNPEGKPILFLHGWQSSHEDTFETTHAYYESRYRCFYIDFLGYGGSRSYIPGTNLSICDQNAQALASLIDTLHLQDLSIYGYCMGAIIGALTAMVRPLSIKSLVMVDAFLYFDPVFLPFLLPGLRYPMYKFILQTKVGLSLTKIVARLKSEVSAEFISRQKKHPVKVNLDYLRDMFTIWRRGYVQKMLRVSCPSLFVMGDQTVVTVKKSMDFWTRHLHNARGAIIANASHYVVKERPEAVNKIILDFLQETIIPNSKNEAIAGGIQR